MPGPLGPVDELFESAAQIPGVLAPLPQSGSTSEPSAAAYEHSTGAPGARVLCWGGEALTELFKAADGLPEGALPYASPELAGAHGAPVLPNSYASAYSIDTVPDDLFAYGPLTVRKERCGCGGPKLK
jgi:hypothetical protein